MQVQPYLFFDGRAEEAIEFYRSAIDAEGIAIERQRARAHIALAFVSVALPVGGIEPRLRPRVLVQAATVTRTRSGMFGTSHRRMGQPRDQILER